MLMCQFGMHINVQGHRNANVCKQTYDACCTVLACGVLLSKSNLQVLQDVKAAALHPYTSSIMICSSRTRCALLPQLLPVLSRPVRSALTDRIHRSAVIHISTARQSHVTWAQ